MTKLPFELYIKIFVLLPQKAKLECALVCRQWTETALQCLYAQVTIKSQGTLDKFINNILNKPFKKNQVKDISLFEPYQFHFDKRQLCQLLPSIQNVQLFKFHFETSSTDISNSIAHASMIEPKSTIKQLDENGTCDFILYLIKSNLCGRLERLCLSCSPEFGSRKIPLPLLKNMASLKMLTLGLHGYEFTIRNAELIHDNLPSITDFNCYAAKLAKSGFPLTIKPSSTTKSISFSFNRINGFQNTSEISREWLIYISKKYTGLQKLFLNIKEYGNVSFQDKNDAFEKGWLPLLKSIGPQLEQIGNINIPNNINVFEILDMSEYNVKDLSIHSTPGVLDLLDEFTQSNQRNNIQKLAIKNVMMKPKISLKDTRLVELELVFSLCYPMSFSISDFLKGTPPTLKSLTMEHADINYDGLDGYQRPSITTLYINRTGSVPVSFKSKEHVCRCCPNLKRLHLFESSINFFI
jgi:hypothetical protein